MKGASGQGLVGQEFDEAMIEEGKELMSDVSVYY